MDRFAVYEWSQNLNTHFQVQSALIHCSLSLSTMSDLEPKLKELMTLAGDNTKRLHEVLDDLKQEYLSLQKYNLCYQQRVSFLYQRFQKIYTEVSPDQLQLIQLLKDLRFTQASCNETEIGRATLYKHKTQSQIANWMIYHEKTYMQDKTECTPYDYETKLYMTNANGKYLHSFKDRIQLLIDYYKLTYTTCLQLCVLIENATIGNYCEEYIYHGCLVDDNIFDYKVTFFDDEWPKCCHPQSDFDNESPRQPGFNIQFKSEQKIKIQMKKKKKI
jgi:hypothetical protein